MTTLNRRDMVGLIAVSALLRREGKWQPVFQHGVFEPARTAG